MNDELISYLESFATDKRRQRMEYVLNNRTRNITVVLEDIYQPMNASAVLRHCDALGIQDIHIIENRNSWRTNKDVDLGTAQWLTVNRYNEHRENTSGALKKLKENGYKIVATSPHEKSCSLHDLDPTESKIALVFGTELTGISETVKKEADMFMTIPMYGFVESFNISASCAITLNTLIHKLRKEESSWQLTSRERKEVYLSWLRNTIKNAERLEQRWKEDKRPL